MSVRFFDFGCIDPIVKLQIGFVQGPDAENDNSQCRELQHDASETVLGEETHHKGEAEKCRYCKESENPHDRRTVKCRLRRRRRNEHRVDQAAGKESVKRAEDKKALGFCRA